jgi:hypothetical protein
MMVLAIRQQSSSCSILCLFETARAQLVAQYWYSPHTLFIFYSEFQLRRDSGRDAGTRAERQPREKPMPGLLCSSHSDLQAIKHERMTEISQEAVISISGTVETNVHVPRFILYAVFAMNVTLTTSVSPTTTNHPFSFQPSKSK